MIIKEIKISLDFPVVPIEIKLENGFSYIYPTVFSKEDSQIWQLEGLLRNAIILFRDLFDGGKSESAPKEKEEKISTTNLSEEGW